MVRICSAAKLFFEKNVGIFDSDFDLLVNEYLYGISLAFIVERIFKGTPVSSTCRKKNTEKPSFQGKTFLIG